MIKSRQKFLNTTFVFIDALVILVSFILAWILRFKTGLFEVLGWHISLETFLLPIIIIMPIYLILYSIFGLYQSHRLSRIGKEITSLIKANFIGLFVFLAILFVFKQINYSRLALIFFASFNILFSVSERVLLRIFLRKIRAGGNNLKHVLVIGAGDSARGYTNKIEQHKYLGYNIIGYLDDQKNIGYKVTNARVIGRLNDLGQIIQTQSIDEIVIAISLREYDKLGEIITVCEKYGVKALIIPDYYKYIPAKPHIDQLDDLPMINIRYVPLDNSFNMFLKRIMDIVLSLVGIILTSPLMLVLIMVIKRSSPGPVLFKQVRVGLHRREFNMYKFRSMKLQEEDEEKQGWTCKDDPRRTRVGEFMRKTSIDELPQLVNVLKGDMSIIGPRPERPYFVEKFREEIPKYMIKHHVRPGITGWAQVNGFRGDTSIKERIEHDIYYIENWNLLMDIKIIALTIIRGFINKNAY